MSSTSTKTNPIRVSVAFKESSVFAGEDVQCTITFKNVASTQAPAERTPSHASSGDARYLHPERSRSKPLPVRAPSVAPSVAPSIAPSIPSSVQPSASKNSSIHDVAVIPQGAQSAAPPGRVRGHRPALSLNTPHLPGSPRSPSALNNIPNGSTTPVHKHGRSLSIMSIHSDAVSGTNTGSGAMAPPKRPPRGHGRSASLQVVSGRGGSMGAPNNRGEILGHDLMSPYIILRDQATVNSIENSKSQLIPNGSISKRTNGEAKEAQTEFENYVRNLLETAQRDANASLLSPTEAPKEYRRRRSTVEDHPVNSMKEAIDFAILRSNTSFSSSASTNRFEIARNGRRVAVIKLARPAFRLGETISAIIDFDNAQVPVYGIAVTLESSEKIDPAIALRSSASIYRVTRKVHASFAENTLFARRVSFAPTVPPNATPEFITSGISLEWKLRVEFVTPRIGNTLNSPTIEKPSMWGGQGLLEELTSDDRGTVLAALERLNCETFEVAVPIRVYGALTGSEGLNVAGEQDEGFAI
ncbi:Rgp1 [Botryosphaeria dothidea]|uniref:Rgp1 n=1 Tax=Botryosphaeria dothidea TaxID=55169 RepID=A0A8H4J4Q6_9PEZI|nr:Rgp1 [Botryosphaeria dothidea]